MGNHFDAIGFPVPDRDALSDLVMRTATTGVPTDLPDGGRLVTLGDASGGSVVVVVQGDGRIVCSKPAFASSTPLRALVGGGVSDPGGCPHCDLVSLTVLDHGGEEAFPLYVETADHALMLGWLQPDMAVRAWIAGFAETVEAWPDEEAYLRSHQPPALAPRSLIPSGMFHPDPSAQRPPRAEAIITGVVEAVETRRSETGGGGFIWARLSTLAVALECVFPLDALGESLTHGSVVQGTFWLVGRLEPEAPDRTAPA